MSWHRHAAELAAGLVYPQSRWRDAMTETPRHLLVPHWFSWDYDEGNWELNDGPTDEPAWLAAAYSGQTLVTKVGAIHADDAETGRRYQGRPASSSTGPGLVIDMYRHARIFDEADVLDVGTGSGYGCALLARRLGASHVTSIDVDPRLTSSAAARLQDLGLQPCIQTMDATGDLPGSYDRIIPMVSMPAIPASWLSALRPDGRLVFSLSRTSILITADKQPDGGAAGQVEWYPAAFMTARHQPGDYPDAGDMPDEIRNAEGAHTAYARYPVVDVTWGWELDSMLEVTSPGIRHAYEQQADVQTAWMWHPDGSWARASGKPHEPAVVHQSGPCRLWDLLDDIRERWITEGCLPLRGARAQIDPDGTCQLVRGSWHATIPAAT